jgi:starch-binding outer membrane protein, SusD/RagB family
MKNIFIIIFIFVLAFYSCSDDILDIPAKDRIADDIVWTDANLIKACHNELYNCVLHGFRIHMQSKTTDEAFNSISWDIGIIPAGSLTADNVGSVENTHWTGGGNLYYWNTAFQYIRKINIFLEKINQGVQIENTEQLIAEAKFLRAYIYFMLIQRFGGVPIITASFGMVDDITFTRNSFEECVQFIEKNLTEAISDLPQKYEANDANFGRATQDACKALRSRLYLYAASPLFNPSNDKQKWQKAADAAKELLESGYVLHPNYTTLFNQPSGTPNSEMIFARTFSTTNSHQAPMHNLGRRYGAYGGWWASNGPSQNLIDDYDMINGEPPFIDSNGEKIINQASGYDPQNPYLNRDPRFYHTVIYDSSVYHGDLHEMWVASDGKTWGYDSEKQSSDNPRTNYILRKFMPDDGVVLSWQDDYTNPWIIFRLGEIYLNYAEASLELGDEATCREYISKVRERVGMPPLSNSISGEELRKRLYNERRIELAFEEHRFWDLRRWKLAMVVENQPIYGMKIIKDVNTGQKTYEPILLLQRSFLEHMYLLPIAADEVRKTSLEQNLGY